MTWRRFAASLVLIAALIIRPSAQQNPTADTGAISGTVVDDTGKAVGGALVVLDRVLQAFHYETPAPATERNRSTTTDASGGYRFTGLAAGHYYVSVPVWTRTYPIPPTLTVKPGTFEAAPRPRAAGTMVDADAGHFMTITGPSNVTVASAHPKMYVTTFAGGTTRPANRTELAAGEEKRDVSVVLATQPTVRVQGVVVGSAGPVARATVRLYLDRRDLEAEYPIATATAFTDGAGRFLFMAVASGTYIVDVDRPNPPGDDLRLSATGFPAVVTRDYSAGSDLREYLPETTLTVGASDRHDVALTLRRGALITGTVVVERPMLLANGQLIPPFYIMLGGTSRPVIAVGRNQFLIDDVKPGKYTLGAGPLLEGFSIVSATLNGRDVKSTPIDVGWDGLTGLTITIGDGKGPPPPGPHRSGARWGLTLTPDQSISYKQ